jgi:hypothetical protein
MTADQKVGGSSSSERAQVRHGAGPVRGRSASQVQQLKCGKYSSGATGSRLLPWTSFRVVNGLVPDGDLADGRELDIEAIDVPGAGIDSSQLAVRSHDEQPPAIG